MPVAIESIDTFQELDDGPGLLTAAHDGLVPQWSQVAKRFIMVAQPQTRINVAGGGGGIAQLRDLLDVSGQPGPATDGYAYLYNATVNKFILSEVGVAGETPASILAKLLTVDGVGSLLDADTLDGLDSTAFAVAGHDHALVDLTDVDITPGAGVDGYSVVYDDGSAKFILADVTGGGGYTNEQAQDAVGGILTDTATIDLTYDDAGNAITADVKDGSITATKLQDGAALAEILDDDGAGSGLDADLLDGNEATAFAAASHVHAGEDITTGTIADARIASTITRDSEVFGIVLAADGSGSGLDADTLDGNDSTAFAAASHTHPSTDVTDFDEAAQDAVGGMIADTATIDLTYTDATPELKADVKADSISNTLLSNMAQATVKGRADGAGTGDPTDLSATQLLTIVKTVDGSGSGLDADLLDGNEASAFAAASHTHDAGDITSGTLDEARIPSGVTRDSEVFGIVLANDGAGSGLDADTLDGNDSAAFAAASHTHASGDVTDFDEAAQDAVGGMIADTATIDLTYTDATPALKADVKTDSIDNTFLANMAQATVKGRADGAGTGDPTDLSATQLLTIVKTVDGSGSGLDADLLDGNEASAFAAASHVHAGEDITSGTVADARIASTITRDSEVFGIVLAADGAGSGLDADLLDGQSSAYYLDRANHTGTQTASTISDFGEAAQDAVGGALVDTATVDFTYNDAGNQITADVKDDSITYAKLQNVSATDRLLGRDTAGAGDTEEISLGASLEFSGSGSIQRAALTGDVTASANSNATTIANNAVSDAKLRDSAALSVIGRSANSSGDPADIAAANDGEVLRRSGTALGFGTVATAGIANDAVTYAKLQNISATDRLLGRDTAGAGDAEEISLGASLEFSGSGSIQRAALTGDVTASANSNATTIANDAVSNAKLANMATKTYKGRTSSGTGDPEDISAAALAADIQAGVDHGSIAGLSDDDHTQYLLASGARTGATSQPQAFTYNPISGFFDIALNDATNGSHFNDNNGTYPSGWTEVTAGFSSASAPAGTSYRYGFWRLNGDPTVTAWKYRKQTGITIESLPANTFQSFSVGPLMFRDGAYAADVDYYFGAYRDNSGIDENTFIRVHIWWDSASALWKVRGESKDGTTQTNGSWYTLPLPLIQPLYLRLRYRYTSPRTVRAYIGYVKSPISDFLLTDTNVGTVTLGNVWWQFHMSRSTGVNDYLLIGGIDTSLDP